MESAQDLNLKLFNNILTSPDVILNQLESSVEYLPPELSKVVVHHKSYPIPRSHAIYGNSGLKYAFSGLNLQTKPWLPVLLDIKAVVEEISGYDYNFVMINRYKDGSSCIAAHKDDEKSLVKNHPIATISLGAERPLVFTRPGFEKVTYELKNNSLLLMLSPTNEHWSHSLPRDPSVKDFRLSLTFRKSNLKRACPDLTMPAAKRIAITLHKLPPNVFHLGNAHFASVSVFGEQVKVHIRRYDVTSDCLSYVPTKDGLTMSPFIWEAFSKAGTFLNFKKKNDFIVVHKELFVTVKDWETINFQRMYTKQDGALQFNETVVTLNKEQFDKLLLEDNIRQDISSAARRLMCTELALKCVTKCVNERTASSGDVSDLISSLAKIFKKHLSQCITDIFECNGCEQDYENQLGHECLTQTREEHLFLYFDTAFAKINVSEVVKEFIADNQCDVLAFFRSLDVDNLVNHVKEFYLMDDEFK